MANNFSSVPIPQFGFAPNRARMNSNISDIDFDFDFLTQYLLFDEADMDIASSLTHDQVGVNSKLLNYDGQSSSNLNTVKVEKGSVFVVIICNKNFHVQILSYYQSRLQ